MTDTTWSPTALDRRVAGAVVVVNPAAAGVTIGRAHDVLDRVRRRFGTAVTVATDGPGHAARIAAEAAATGTRVVAALGGDGTAREVAEALAGSARTALLALPGGSGNSISRNIWGPLDLDGVLDEALSPSRTRVRRLDLLRLPEVGKVALLGASSGFLGAVLQAATTVTGLQGRDRYLAAAAHVLGDMPRDPTRVVVDGTVVFEGLASSVTLGGGRYRAWDLQLLPDSVLDDGLLDVCVLEALDLAALTEIVPLVPAGEHLGHPEVHYARGREVSIERTDGKPLTAEYDGEIWTTAGPKLSAEVVADAVPVLAPLRPAAG